MNSEKTIKLDSKELLEDNIEIEVAVEAWDITLVDYTDETKIKIRMKSGYKGYKSGDDYYLDKSIVKKIPKMKYKILL